MKRVSYRLSKDTIDAFRIEYNAENQIVSICNPDDPYQMNWTEGNQIWGTVACEQELSAEVTRTYTEYNTLIETYTFQNETDFDIFMMGTELGIYTPFPDYYTKAEVCMVKCCNTHIWCGGSGSYIMALRMGGGEQNLGLVLREGSLQGYSVERMSSTDGRDEELSNHRGDFILHPENLHLKPGDTYTLSWEIFWFKGKADFKKRLRNTPDFIYIDAPKYLLAGEKLLKFSIHICSDNIDREPVIRCGTNEAACIWKKADGSIEGEIREEISHTGEYVYEVSWKGRRSRASFLVLPDVEELAERRCRFIAGFQQCHEENSYLNGAYLIYDNEEQQQYYAHQNDHNGGRERVGMGILMAYYLQKHSDDSLQKSLDLYQQYVLRELFDEQTGEVFNDAPRCRDYIRLYNYPWMSRFFLELYQLKREERLLDYYYKCTEHFYQEGGVHFYAIGMPMQESVRIFQEAGRKEQAEKLLAYYREQGDFILSCGRNYPAHEVDYEQSIVAPAAIYMCELYRLTGEKKYKAAAKEQMEILDLFQGFQPDYHMNEAAIRHWDGYWFGKRRCLGDTFPHYWTALSGCAYKDTAEIADSGYYAEKAERTLQAVLSLFREDGSASCAMVYPMSVNHRAASFYDPWANDQDWGLYFNLKYARENI